MGSGIEFKGFVNKKIKELKLKGAGVSVSIHSLLRTLIADLAIWLFVAIGMTVAETSLWAKYMFVLLTITLSAAFVFTLVGGFAMLAGKEWGKGITLFGVFFSIIHVSLFVLSILPSILYFLLSGIIIMVLLLFYYLFFLVALWQKLGSLKSLESRELRISDLINYIILFIFILFFLFAVVFPAE